jgi:hypothetical protein
MTSIARRVRVRLRIEEDFRVAHIVRLGTLQIGCRHVVEVLLLQQHAGASVIDVEEGLQVGESIGRAQRFHRRPA